MTSLPPSGKLEPSASLKFQPDQETATGKRGRERKGRKNRTQTSKRERSLSSAFRVPPPPTYSNLSSLLFFSSSTHHTTPHHISHIKIININSSSIHIYIHIAHSDTRQSHCRGQILFPIISFFFEYFVIATRLISWASPSQQYDFQGGQSTNQCEAEGGRHQSEASALRHLHR